MQNPYAPPAEPVPPSKEDGVSPTKQLASRGKRLGAAILDAIAMFLLGSALSRTYVSLASTTQTVLFAQLGILAASSLQWFLIATRGQTLGKMMLKIRIVRKDGSVATPFHALVLRTGPLVACQCLLIFVPAIKIVPQILLLIDDLFIFAPHKRCLHDQIADTCVVDVS